MRASESNLSGLPNQQAVSVLDIDIHLIEGNEGQIDGLPKNPRFIKGEKFKKLVRSIQDDPEMLNMRECIVVPHKGKYIVIAGNMRWRACKELKYKTVPCKVLPEGVAVEKLRAITIKDNIAYGEHDFDELMNAWDCKELESWGLDIPGTEEEEEELKEEYSAKLGEVIYEPKNTKHKIADLFSRETKFDAEIEALKNDELKEMLKARSAFFGSFNYAKIADYYAYQATGEEKQIMEKLALVLLDRDKLIENGFSEIIDSVMEENGFND